MWGICRCYRSPKSTKRLSCALYVAHRIFFFKGRFLAMCLQGDFFLEIQQMETLSTKVWGNFLCLSSKPILLGAVNAVKRLNPNRSLDRYCSARYWEDNFLSSFIFLLASCFLFVFDVARYAFELTINHLLNNPMKSVQDLMTDLG